MADRKQGAGLSSRSSAAVHKSNTNFNLEKYFNDVRSFEIVSKRQEKRH